jgi:dihydrofolate reductase
MRKLIAAMKVSMDMKFQGPGDYADWVDGWSEDYGLTPEIDACLLGGQMQMYGGYEKYWSAMRSDPHGPSPMTGTIPTANELAWSELIPALPHYVLSRTLTEASWPNTRFLRSFEDVAALKAGPGKDIYLMGGGGMVRTLINEGLVDELRLITYPVIAGGPHSLFGPGETRSKAELVSLANLPGGLIRSSYRILPRDQGEGKPIAA